MSNAPKVFISATSGDLREIRGTVRDALLAMECLPVVQDHFPPDYRDVSEMLREKISGCDALIHIAGMRYGAEPDPSTLPKGTARRSYTQMELDLAREMKLKKIYTFVCPEDFPYGIRGEDGEPLPSEPAELAELQHAHRERLLSQGEMFYEVKRPEDFATRIREIQLGLERIKGQVKKSNRRMLAVGAAIAVSLAAVAGGVYWLKRDTGAVVEALEIQRQAPRVIEAYQDRFLEIRNDPNNREISLTNALIDKMVRAELPGIVGLDPEQVSEILEVEAPRLAADRAIPSELKLAALFAMGDYDATLEEVRKKVDGTVKSLRTGGNAAVAKFEQEPAKELLGEATRYYRGSQALIEKDKDPEEWAFATSLLGHSLYTQGKYHEAEKLYREALDTMKRALGQEHPNTLNQTTRLAIVLRYQGKNDEAELLLRETLKFLEPARGLEHPNTILAISALGNVLADQGNYAEAEKLFSEGLESSEEVFGRQHPSTLGFIISLGAMFREQGAMLQKEGNYTEAENKFADAEKLLREALESCERVLGRQHPFSLVVSSNLARGWRDQGRVRQWQGKYTEAENKFADAEKLLREILPGAKKVLGGEHPDILGILENLAGALAQQNKIAEAEKLWREVMETRSRVLGPEHPDAIRSTVEFAMLAMVSRNKNKYAEAEKLLREALETSKRVLGPEHPDTLLATTSLAIMLQEQGKYAEAEKFFREAMETSKRVLGPEHPDTLLATTSLAMMLREHGKSAEAEPLLLEVIVIKTGVFGSEHPQTLALINYLAFVLRDQGKYAEAEKLALELVETRKRVLGREHPDTLTATRDLAFVLQDQGKFTEAEPLFREALKGLERAHGREHPDTLTSIQTLAYVLEEQGKYAEAEPLCREALEGLERVHGREHPETLRSIHRLAVQLSFQSKKTEAEPLVREVMEGLERELGRGHPDTVQSIDLLSRVLLGQGKMAEAEPLCREALEGLERELGSEHQQSLRSSSDLALILIFQGKMAEAEPIARKALEGLERVLGPEHPVTLQTMTILAMALESQGTYKEAGSLLREALEIRTRVFGREHPDTVQSIDFLIRTLLAQGKHAEAEPLAREALEIVKATSAVNSLEVAEQHNVTGVFYYKSGRFADAAKHYGEALRIYGEHPRAALTSRVTRMNLASAQRELGETAEARATLTAVIGELDAEGEADPGFAARARHHLALCETEEKNWEEAEKWIREALARYAKMPNPPAQREESLDAYRDILKGKGLDAAEIDSRLAEFE